MLNAKQAPKTKLILFHPRSKSWLAPMPDRDCCPYSSKFHPIKTPVPSKPIHTFMENTFALIRRLASDRFYGSITLKSEAGNVVVLKKEETIKPQNYRDNRGEAIEATSISNPIS